VWQELEGALGEETPARFFEVLRGCGALARIFPELERLFGVPQPKHHHPEEDTGTHMLLVLAQAARLSADKRVRFAALVHDLGKGTTPPSEWPRHLAHEHRGVALVQALCERLRVPGDYRDLALIVTRHHGVYHRAEALRPSTFLKSLEAMDAFRRTERVEQFLLACEADARGRPGFEESARPETELFRTAFRAAQEVTARELVAQGLKGERIREELHRQRVRAIAHALQREETQGGEEE
jgi:tRNA nucleotidyltransferase (CCA-adding enzyme)